MAVLGTEPMIIKGANHQMHGDSKQNALQIW